MYRMLSVFGAALFALAHGAATGAAAERTTRIYSYNARNQLEAVTDSAHPDRNVVFSHDANGNRLSKNQGGVVTTYAWDARNRLRSVARNGNAIARYDYDADGRRIEKELYGGRASLTRYVYDGPRLIAETNVLGNTLATYTYDADDRLVAMRRGGQSYAYLLDALGTPVAMMRADGIVAARYRVDAWGNPTATVGDVANLFGFTGYPVDDETGLHYANARYYDSELGAFLSEDPAIGDPTRPVTLHPYLYANANPLIYLDRSGRTAELVHVLDGAERNQQSIVGMANELKAMRRTAPWYARPLVEAGVVGTVVLTAGNRLGQGVVTMANAGANVVLNATDTYIVDLGAGADPANAEVDAFFDDTFAAAEGAMHDPRAVAVNATNAAIDPYRRAYAGDTAAQLDVAANIDPRRVTSDVMRAMAPARDPPKIGSATAYVVVEGRGGRPLLAPSGGGAPVDVEHVLAVPHASPYAGGPHSRTKLPPGDGFDSHHMPAKAVSGLGVDAGPAIKMDPADHARTSSNGKRPGSGAYREQLKDMIDDRRMRDAMATEIRDVRAAAEEVSKNLRKYNEAMQQMLVYAKSMGWLDKDKKP